MNWFYRGTVPYDDALAWVSIGVHDIAVVNIQKVD